MNPVDHPHGGGEGSTPIGRKKFDGTRLNYSSYEKKFYAIVRFLEYWRRYIKPNSFALHLNHKCPILMSNTR